MANDKQRTSGVVRVIVGILLVVIVILAAVYVRRLGGGTSEPEETGPQFKNATTEVAYVGTEACAGCHEPQYKSYLETTHSKSLAKLDPAKEPIPADYHHKPSDLHYRMYKDEASGRMRVEESLQLEDGEPYVLADHAIDYLIGSGNHSRSYLVEIDGWLYEAPVTWYTQKKAWGISPGYNRTMHLGFARPAGTICMRCHVGHVEPKDESINRLVLHENAIGCERCHGPGELHADLRAGETEIPAGEDLTIIDPRRMSRDQSMQVCAQCHMDHSLNVYLPGKKPGDWRPGMPWTDVMVTYRPTITPPGMTVVGHVDQLRQSKCFEASKMTCLTCHDPHAKAPEELAAKHLHYNGKCLTCHQHCGRQPDDGPGIVPAEGDDCIKCHMPTADTDIVHIAFTHHRIGIHGLEWTPPAGMSDVPELKPLDDDAHLPQAVRDRNLGLAYLQFLAHNRQAARVAAALSERAYKLLESAVNAGLRDPEAEAAMASLLFGKRKPKRGRKHAERALALAKEGLVLSPDRRVTLLVQLAHDDIGLDRFDDAQQRMDQAQTIRRDVTDLFYKLDIAQRLGDTAMAAKLAEEMLRILPNSPDVHYRAAEAFEAVGRKAEAKLHNRVGVRIHMQMSSGQKHLPDGGDG